MGIPLRRITSPSRRASQSNPNSTSSNNSRSNTNNNSSSSSSSSSSSTGNTRKFKRRSRSRSTSPHSRSNYYLDNPYRQRQPVVMMVPNSLLPVTAYFPRDYEFEDEGYDSASSSTSESSVSPVPALGWRPTHGTLEMEFMFGDMDEEFMQELTRESTPSSDDEHMMELDTYAPGSNEESASSRYDHSATESEGSEARSRYDRQDRMGGRVVDEDYD